MDLKDLKHHPSAPVARVFHSNQHIGQLIVALIGLLFYAIPFSFANETILQMFEKDFQKIVAGARPAVVKVVATQVNSVWLQPNPKRLALTRQDIGSGILIDTTGHVVTTTFEMEDPGEIEIVFSDGKVSAAELIGTDTLTDIAVLRIADTSLITASKAVAESIKWGDSSKIDMGSWTVTIGSSYGHSPIISFGIVGGWDTLPDQMCGELIKINAAITPGNSGGAVVNTSGEIVGMILAVLTEPTGINSPANVLFGEQDDIDITQFLVQPSPLGTRNQEIAFALPIEAVRTVAKEIIEHGKVARGWLGVEVDIGESGVYVTRVIDGSPAHESGLLPKDVILELDETAVRSYAELLRCVVTKRPDTSVQLKINRNGTAQHCTVVLGEKPVMPMPLTDSVPSIGR